MARRRFRWQRVSTMEIEGNPLDLYTIHYHNMKLKKLYSP